MKFSRWQIPLLAVVVVVCASAFARFPPDSAESVAAWVQAIGSIGAIAIAIWVSHRQYEDSRELEQLRAAAEKAKAAGETRAWVQAIREEISTIWDDYSKDVHRSLCDLPDGQPFSIIFPVGTDAFTIYNGASSAVGSVDDEELRRAIVVAYAKAKGLVYSFQFNNALVNAYTNFEVVYHAPDRDTRLAGKLAILIDYAKQLKDRDAEVTEVIKDVLVRIDNWLRLSIPVTV